MVTHSTLKDIANRLGISVAAVSLGLHGSPRISRGTKKRIAEAAEELGYRPNPMMSEIASSRWQNAGSAGGSIVAYIDTIEGRNYVGGVDLRPSFREQALRLGYRPEVFLWSELGTSSKLQRALRFRNITEVIIGPIFDSSLVMDFDWEKLICVQVGLGFLSLPLHSVTKDYFNAIVLAWQKAVEHGYHRIGIVLLQHRVKFKDDVLRRSAVYACQTDLFPHLPQIPPFYYTTQDPRPDDFVAWIKAHDPEVIIGFSQSHYLIYQHAFGRKIPYISLHVQKGHPFAGILEDAENCSRQAVDLLHFCRRTHQWGLPKKRIDHVVEPSWVEGESLPQK